MIILICSDKYQLDKAFLFSNKLLSLGIRCVMDEECAVGDVPPGVDFLKRDACDEICDMIVSVGGDGTMLKVSQRAVKLNKPVFGLNAGRIGFLCAFDYEDVGSITREDIESLVLNERMLLEVVLDQQPENKYLAVNDMVLNKGGASKTIELKVFGGGNLIGDYRADGVIVSTPTGSTGYSLSAGGPIVDPSLDVVLVTPVCPHTMFARSIAFGGEESIRIEPSGRNDTDVYLSVDSSYTFLLEEHSGVTVKKSEETLKLLTSNKRSYFEMLSKRVRGI